MYAAQFVHSKNQNKIFLQFIIAANACHVTQCQLFMFECVSHITSNCIASEIRYENGVRLIIPGRQCSVSIRRHTRLAWKTGTNGYELYNRICTHAFEAKSFASAQTKCLKNINSMRWFIERDMHPFDSIAANILHESKPAENFNKFFSAISSRSTGRSINEIIFHESRFMNELHRRGNLPIYTRTQLESRLKVNTHWLRHRHWSKHTFTCGSAIIMLSIIRTRSSALFGE